MSGSSQSASGKMLRCALLGGALVAVGFSGGTVWQTVTAPSGILRAEALVNWDQPDPHVGADGDFTFFSYRRYLWVVKKSVGKARFFHVPESAAADVQLTESRVYEIDQEVFPLHQVRYQVSERNLTNYLWITNPVTGKAQFIRATREGGFDESPIVSIGGM